MGTSTSYNRQEVVPCPRCHETCGWCSEYRFAHGHRPVPPAPQCCKVPGYDPEGANCPVCGGEKRVMRFIEYGKMPPERINSDALAELIADTADHPEPALTAIKGGDDHAN